MTYDARARGVSVSALRAGTRSWTLYPRQPVTFNHAIGIATRDAPPAFLDDFGGGTTAP